MKRFISHISILVCLALVLSMAPTAFAAGNGLALGNNVLTLGVVHNYTVEADGILKLEFHDVLYGKNGGVHEGNLHKWLDFLVNETAVDKFTTEIEVSAGDVVTVQMVSRDGDNTYKAQLYLTFTPSADSEEENKQAQMMVSSVEALPGDEIVLNASMVNNPGITNGKITVDYDTAGLELVDIDVAPAYEAGFVMAVGYLENANVNFVAVSDIAGDFTLFSMKFKVKDDAEGAYQVGLTLDLMKNDAEEDIAFEVVAGTVSVHVCDPVHVEEVPATTTSPGVKAHDRCACGKLYIDGVEVTEEDLVIPMLGQIIVDSAEAASGQEVVLNVVLKNNPGITDGKITVDYDTTGLELVDIDVTPALEAGFAMAMGYVDNASMNFVALSDIAGDFTLFSLTFKVKDDAADGDYVVGLVINRIVNDAVETVGFVAVPGTVTVHNCQAGEPVIENLVEATCTTDGSYDEVVYCAVCGEELSREHIVVAATGHSYTAVVTEPTCTEQGYTTYTCHCGDSYVDDYVDATGHEMGEWYVYTPSTVTVRGEKRCDCANCDYYETEEMNLLGDVNGDGNVDTTDAKLIMQYDVYMIDESALDLFVADVNGDGVYDTTDAKLIMQFDLGMIVDFPKAD